MNKVNLRVLLIEDDAADMQLVARCIRKARAKIELIWARSLSGGLLMLATEDFDLIVSDLSLPDSVGLETISQIRDCAPNLPIIVLTTLDDQEIELTSIIVGAQDYLLKSEITPNSLELAMHHAIQREENVMEIQRLLAEVEAQRETLVEQQRMLKRKNQRLRRLYKTAHRFVDNVSHEFRTPLTVIKDYVSLVREGLVGPVSAEQCRMLDIANVRTDDLNNMVDDMLDLSKLESGLLGVWRRPGQLSDIIESVCSPLKRKADLKEISFEIDIDSRIPMVYCDADKAARVIINLVTNALKFCGDPGSVRLWARAHENLSEVVIGVTDNGPGIEKTQLTEIFKRFRQLDTHLKSGSNGFGLGLNIAKELVDLNLGKMSIESEIGKGSTFSFTMPLNDPVAVVTRYLKRLRRLKNVEPNLAMIRVQVDESVSSKSAHEVDAFLNYLLRRNDLLFRVGDHSWLFVLPIPRLELSCFSERAESEWVKTNRNRPLGPLPKLEITTEGTWPILSPGDAIVDQFICLLHADLALGSSPPDADERIYCGEPVAVLV